MTLLTRSQTRAASAASDSLSNNATTRTSKRVKKTYGNGKAIKKQATTKKSKQITTKDGMDIKFDFTDLNSGKLWQASSEISSDDDSPSITMVDDSSNSGPNAFSSSYRNCTWNFDASTETNDYCFESGDQTLPDTMPLPDEAHHMEHSADLSETASTICRSSPVLADDHLQGDWDFGSNTQNDPTVPSQPKKGCNTNLTRRKQTAKRPLRFNEATQKILSPALQSPESDRSRSQSITFVNSSQGTASNGKQIQTLDYYDNQLVKNAIKINRAKSWTSIVLNPEPDETCIFPAKSSISSSHAESPMMSEAILNRDNDQEIAELPLLSKAKPPPLASKTKSSEQSKVSPIIISSDTESVASVSPPPPVFDASTERHSIATLDETVASSLARQDTMSIKNMIHPNNKVEKNDKPNHCNFQEKSRMRRPALADCDINSLQNSSQLHDKSSIILGDETFDPNRDDESIISTPHLTPYHSTGTVLSKWIDDTSSQYFRYKGLDASKVHSTRDHNFGHNRTIQCSSSILGTDEASVSQIEPSTMIHDHKQRPNSSVSDSDANTSLALEGLSGSTRDLLEKQLISISKRLTNQIVLKEAAMRRVALHYQHNMSHSVEKIKKLLEKEQQDVVQHYRNDCDDFIALLQKASTTLERGRKRRLKLHQKLETMYDRHCDQEEFNNDKFDEFIEEWDLSV